MTIANFPAAPEILDGQYMLADDYLDMERSGVRESHGKYELFNQTLRFMTGASTAHNDITAHITALLQWTIWQNNLTAYVTQSDMKVVSYLPNKNYFYPDIVVTVGERLYHDRKTDVLINPNLLIEVLSDETEAFDRGEKFTSYRQIPSLQEYILISQYTRRLEHFYKNDGGLWVVGQVIDSGILPLKTLDFSLPVEQIYRQLPF